MLENIDNKAARGSISQIILKALSLGDKYGYEICKDIERLSNGKLILKQPSLYSCLRRMEEQKLISSYWKDSLLGGRRHYYSVTEKGKQIYEENKINWKSDEELLNSLPDSNTINSNNKPCVNDEEMEEGLNKTNNDNNNTNVNDDKNTLSSPTQLKQTNTLYILDQENLFNIARRKDEDIKKIKENNENNDEKKSFLQFDFFEQNIKVVKKNNDKPKEDIQVFTNRYSDMDNHSQDIEPEDDLTNNEQLSSSRVSLSSIFDKEIKRESIISSSSKNEINTSEPLEQNKSNTVSKGSIFDYMKSAVNENAIDNDNNNANNNFNLGTTVFDEELQSMKDNEDSNNKEYNLDNISADVTTFDTISWEKTENGDAPLFNHDYKSAIGKLYNNSQLKDPYEQNKFQTFKEIFPSSTLKEKEKTEIKQTKIDAVIQSSSNSNIDCDDIKMLNNLYNLQGLNIKVHNNIENKRQNKIYKDKNKLNMICAWIITFVGLAEFLISYLILSSNNLFLKGQSVVYLCCMASLLLICLIYTLKNFFDRYKLIIIKKNFTKDIIISLLIFILLAIGTFAINIAFGMSGLGQVSYLSYWLIPCLLFSNLLLAQGVYAILLRIKYFNS